MVGEGNTQIIASHITNYNFFQGTWTDGVAPPPLADDSGVMTESPYRGLAAFGEQDAGFFFGRKEAAGQVLDRMSQQLGHPGLLMVSGVSGAGKSSLLRAGVLPPIRHAGLAGAPEAAGWPCIVLTPGREPLRGLASVAVLAGIDAATTHQALKANPADFVLTARQVAEFQPVGTSPLGHAVTGHGRRLLLMVDQFEQLFTQCPDDHQRLAFLTALHAAATAGHDAVERPAALVVLVVRADFEARCAEYPLLAEAVQNRYLVTAMTERELRMVITEPAKKARSHVDKDLVSDLLDDIRSRTPGMAALEPGPGMAAPAGTLPLLSHVLDTAWRARAGNSLTVADYDRVGGIERAVADSAERAYKRLTPAQKAAARTIFLGLIATSPDGTITAHRATRAEFLNGKGTAQVGDVEAVLEAFAAERLLTLAADTVEISHEVLLRAWPLLHEEWLADREADRIVRTRLRVMAGEWDRSGRDPSYLYAGTLLQDATDAAARAARSRQPEPSPVEQEFLHASNRARRRAATVRRAALAALLSLTTGLAVVAIAADHATKIAARQRDAAIASNLVTESEAEADTNPTTSKIESLAAWQIDPTPQSRYALISAAIRPIPGGLTDWIGPDQVAFSRDGRILATCSRDYTVRLWNSATQQQIGHLPSKLDCAPAMVFSPDGRILATGADGGIQLWNVATQQPIGHPLPFSAGDAILAMAFSPDGRTLAAGGAYDGVRLWNVATHQQVGHPFPPDPGDEGVSSVAFSPGGLTLATGSGGRVRLWNVATQQPIGHPFHASTAPGVTYGISAMAFSPDGRTLATGSDSGRVGLWNVTTQRQIGHSLGASTAGGVIAMAFSPDGRTLATGGADDRVRLWNVATERRVGQYLSVSTASYPGFYTVAFSPDGQNLAIGIQDGMVWLWNVTAHRQTNLPLTSPSSGAASVAFSPDGQTLATGNFSGRVRLWNVTNHQQIGRTLPAITAGEVTSVAFSPDGRTLATGNFSGRVRLWNVTNHQQIGRTLRVGPDILSAVDAVAFSPDGRTLATGSQAGTVRLWNVTTHQQTGRTFRASTAYAGTDGVTEVAFSPNGQTLVTGTQSGRARLWNVTTQRQTSRLPTVGDAVAFSPDGRTLATGSQAGTVRLWNVTNHQQTGRALSVSADTTSVDAVAFSPDSQTLATANRAGTVRLWNVTTRQQIGQPFTIGNGSVNAMIFRPDGRTLATASASGTRTWDTTPLAHPLSEVCDQIGGSITPGEWSQYVPPGPAYSDTCP